MEGHNYGLVGWEHPKNGRPIDVPLPGVYDLGGHTSPDRDDEALMRQAVAAVESYVERHYGLPDIELGRRAVDEAIVQSQQTPQETLYAQMKLGEQ